MSDSKRERLLKVLRGEVPDRPPITAYRHIPHRERMPEDLAANTIEQYNKFDWDIIKIHPAASVANEVWGSTYDYTTYEKSIFPKLVSREFNGPDDLHLFTKKSAESGPLADMVKAVELVKAKLGEDDVPVFMTLFTPINYICDALGAPTVRRHEPADRRENVLFELFKTQPEALKTALDNIT
ncbi:MAG: uroporphyrinogen decarboxylase family protein, partial [Gallicola sp.]|nr:uroporphyrinogen decarboxylase family protein [Gallicola sp.]